jgi:lactoylglutathione lyase
MSAARVTGYFHSGVTVSDMECSLQFYRDTLGLELAFDTIVDGPYLHVVLGLTFSEIRAAYLHIPGGGYVELLEYRGIERLSAASRPCDYGGGHLCLYVDGIDELADQVFAAGYRARSAQPVEVTAGPNAGARTLYLLDPDGFPVELFQRPNE